MRTRVAVLAVVVGLLALAASAHAAKPGVELSEEAGKPPTATGALTETVLSIGPEEGENVHCLLYGRGPLKSNGKPKDKIALTEGPLPLCFEERLKVKGEVTGATVSATALTVDAKLTITDKGCAYAFKNPTGALKLPGLVITHGEVKGKRVKSESAPGCAATVTWEWEAGENLVLEEGNKRLTYYAEVS